MVFPGSYTLLLFIWIAWYASSSSPTRRGERYYSEITSELEIRLLIRVKSPLQYVLSIVSAKWLYNVKLERTCYSQISSLKFSSSESALAKLALQRFERFMTGLVVRVYLCLLHLSSAAIPICVQQPGSYFSQAMERFRVGDRRQENFPAQSSPKVDVKSNDGMNSSHMILTLPRIKSTWEVRLEKRTRRSICSAALSSSTTISLSSSLAQPPHPTPNELHTAHSETKRNDATLITYYIYNFALIWLPPPPSSISVDPWPWPSLLCTPPMPPSPPILVAESPSRITVTVI